MLYRRARRSAALPAPRSDPRGHTTATTPTATACAGTTAATGIAVGAEPSGAGRQPLRPQLCPVPGPRRLDGRPFRPAAGLGGDRQLLVGHDGADFTR